MVSALCRRLLTAMPPCCGVVREVVYLQSTPTLKLKLVGIEEGNVRERILTLD